MLLPSRVSCGLWLRRCKRDCEAFLHFLPAKEQFWFVVQRLHESHKMPTLLSEGFLDLIYILFECAGTFNFNGTLFNFWFCQFSHA